jgi:predicted urease superfamily metal-dependent hydrolase
LLALALLKRASKAGGALFYVTVEAEFDFVSDEDGSKTLARTFGEAMDSGDKATNKAMSAAYKYAAFQTFAIPTEGNPDADAETHEVATGMHPNRIREWLDAIAQAGADELEAMVRDGLAAATEVKDREAFVAIREAGKKRQAASA